MRSFERRSGRVIKVPEGSSAEDRLVSNPEIYTPVEDEPTVHEEAVEDDPSVSDEDASEDDGSAPEAPPTEGKGSGVAAWRDYADQLGVAYPDDATRDDIVALVDAS